MTHLVEVEDLTFTFPGRSAASLGPLRFALAEGTWTLLAGRTGAGKSTLLRLLAGVRSQHVAARVAGRATVAGHDALRAAPGSLAGVAGLVLQAPEDQLTAASVEAEVALGLQYLRLPAEEIAARSRAALARFGLAELGACPAAVLSGGQQQRLLLAAITAMRPRLLVLDEPLGQLDPLAVDELLECLEEERRRGTTILVAEHRLDELLPRADRLLVLDEGRLAADLPCDRAAEVVAALEGAGLAAPELTRLAARWGRPASWPVAEAAAAVRAARGPATAATQQAPHEAASRAAAGPVVEVDHLGLRFERRGPWLWRDVSFTLRAGERVAVVGRNGAGKSTLLAVLAGFRRPSAGSIAMPRDADRPDVALLPQSPDLTLFRATVLAELADGPRRAGVPRHEAEALARELADRCGLKGYEHERPQALSRGQRLRVALAAALAPRPRLLLLDEPTTGQDREELARLRAWLATAVVPGGWADALLMVTHDVRFLTALADRVLVLAEGRLLADVSPRALLDRDDLLAAAGLRRPRWFELRRLVGADTLDADALLAELPPPGAAPPAPHAAAPRHPGAQT